MTTEDSETAQGPLASDGDSWPAGIPLRVAVPNVDRRAPVDGISRVMHELILHWGERVQVVPATFMKSRVVGLRNWPWSVALPESADVLLIPQIAGSSSLLGFRGVPTVVLVHDMGYLDLPEDRTALGWGGIISLYPSLKGLERATHLVTDSEFTRERLLFHLPKIHPVRVNVIPLGVSRRFTDSTQGKPEQDRSWLSHKLGVELGHPILTYVGREGARKNLGLLWDTVKLLKVRHPKLQVIKVGPPGKAGWRQITERAVGARGLRIPTDVAFTGTVTDDELARIYRASNVAVSTSLYEGFGLPMLEAMAVGTPVVASKVGAHPEVVGPYGVLADPTPPMMARSIASILSRDDHLKEARRAWAREFTWDRTADQWLDVLATVVRPAVHSLVRPTPR